MEEISVHTDFENLLGKMEFCLRNAVDYFLNWFIDTQNNLSLLYKRSNTLHNRK